jgi:hypothetical protein
MPPYGGNPFGSEELPHFGASLIERHIPERTLLKVINWRSRLIEGHVGRSVDRFLKFFWIGHL